MRPCPGQQRYFGAVGADHMDECKALVEHAQTLQVLAGGATAGVLAIARRVELAKRLVHVERHAVMVGERLGLDDEPIAGRAHTRHSDAAPGARFGSGQR